MCVVSMVYDHYWEKWTQPPFQPSQPVIVPGIPYLPAIPVVPMITQDEIIEFRKLLERAREYDKKHNQPDCELEEKRKKLKKLAEELGVTIDFV